MPGRRCGQTSTWAFPGRCRRQARAHARWRPSDPAHGTWRREIAERHGPEIRRRTRDFGLSQTALPLQLLASSSEYRFSCIVASHLGRCRHRQADKPRIALRTRSMNASLLSLVCQSVTITTVVFSTRSSRFVHRTVRVVCAAPNVHHLVVVVAVVVRTSARRMLLGPPTSLREGSCDCQCQ